MYFSIPFIIFIYLGVFNYSVPPIEITKITPFKESGELRCDISIHSILDDKLQPTLLSGVPIRALLSIQLKNITLSQVYASEAEILIRYNVWDELFIIQYPERKEQFKSLDSLKKNISILKNIKIMSLAELSGDPELQIFLKIQAHTDQSEKFIDSLDRNISGSKFSIGRIIRFFFGSSESDTRWFHSDKFRLNELKNN